MLDVIAQTGLIAVRLDMTGSRTVSLPHLGWTTTASLPKPTPERVMRRAGRLRRG